MMMMMIRLAGISEGPRSQICPKQPACWMPQFSSIFGVILEAQAGQDTSLPLIPTSMTVTVPMVPPPLTKNDRNAAAIPKPLGAHLYQRG